MLYFVVVTADFISYTLIFIKNLIIDKVIIY